MGGTAPYFYSLNEDSKISEERKGEKIGEVAIDLKGLKITGVPPDFSSTFDVGSEVYEVKGLKRENAVLLVSGENSHILFRSGKATASADDQIGLTVDEVFRMISNSAVISSVELRSETDSSWMRTSCDDRLLELLNTEIREKAILNSKEIKQQKGIADMPGKTPWIPINLVFEDGAMLHMQVYPEVNIVRVFGGYIDISEELCREITELYLLGEEYSRIADIVGLGPDSLGYFRFINHVTGDGITSPEPDWDGRHLYDWLRWYRFDRALPETEGTLVFSAELGESEENHRVLDVYEGADRNLFFKVDGETYIIVKGNLRYCDLLEFQEDYMGIRPGTALPGSHNWTN